MTNDIRRSLELFSFTDGVIEIRALECWDRLPEFKSTRYGYFDCQHLDEAAAYVRDLESKWHPVGIYVTLNPALPDLIARSKNQIKKGQRDTSTKNNEIVRRAWMLVDFDPKRPAGISSNEAELATAKAEADGCRQWLTENGFPSPVIAMSGNGQHLLYRIDLPADDRRVEHCLKAIAAKFPLADISTHNAARITKIYGTITRKGDSTADRPHRRSELIEVPEQIEIVPVHRLDWLAEQCKPLALLTTGGTAVDVEAYLRNHNVPVIGEDVWNGSRRWFIRCPNEQAHTTSTADCHCSIWQDQSGMIFAKCFHNSCGVHSWEAIKAAFGPVGAGDFPALDVSGVDLSGLSGEKSGASSSTMPTVGIVQQVEEKPVMGIPISTVDKSVKVQQVGAMTPAFFQIPGVIGKMNEYHRAYAPRPQPELSLIGSIALMGAITGRKIKTISGFRSNIYCIGLAQSGSGKDRPRHDNINALSQARLSHYLAAENPSSDTALVNELEAQPALLMQVDEVAKFFAMTRGANTNQHLKALNTKFLELTGAAGNPSWVPKSWADASKRKDIQHPHLCLFGVGTIDGFWDCVTPSDAGDGFLGRMLIVEAPNYPRLRLLESPPIPSDIVEILRAWDKFQPPVNPDRDLCIEALTVPTDPDALDRLTDHCNLIEDRLQDDPYKMRPIWARCSEMANRLSLIFAASRGPEGLRITLDDANAAIRQANWSVRLLVNRLFTAISDNDEDRNKKKLLQVIRQNGGEMSQSELTRKSQWVNSFTRDGMLKDLLEAELIVLQTLPPARGGGPATKVYKTVG